MPHIHAEGVELAFPASETTPITVNTAPINHPLTASDAIIPAPSTHIHVEEELYQYSPIVESITPTKVKKGLKIKNPGFKRYRSFPFPSLPPYKN